jgi:hypothetical protein
VSMETISMNSGMPQSKLGQKLSISAKLSKIQFKRRKSRRWKTSLLLFRIKTLFKNPRKLSPQRNHLSWSWTRQLRLWSNLKSARISMRSLMTIIRRISSD